MNTILVADDESDVRRSLGVALAYDGFSVEFAKSGEEVLERGNIRELENVIRKYLVLQDAEVVAKELLRQTRERSLAATVGISGERTPTH